MDKIWGKNLFPNIRKLVERCFEDASFKSFVVSKTQKRKLFFWRDYTNLGHVLRTLQRCQQSFSSSNIKLLKKSLKERLNNSLQEGTVSQANIEAERLLRVWKSKVSITNVSKISRVPQKDLTCQVLNDRIITTWITTLRKQTIVHIRVQSVYGEKRVLFSGTFPINGSPIKTLVKVEVLSRELLAISHNEKGNLSRLIMLNIETGQKKGIETYNFLPGSSPTLIRWDTKKSLLFHFERRLVHVRLFNTETGNFEGKGFIKITKGQKVISLRATPLVRRKKAVVAIEISSTGKNSLRLYLLDMKNMSFNPCFSEKANSSMHPQLLSFENGNFALAFINKDNEIVITTFNPNGSKHSVFSRLMHPSLHQSLFLKLELFVMAKSTNNTLVLIQEKDPVNGSGNLDLSFEKLSKGNVTSPETIVSEYGKAFKQVTAALLPDEGTLVSWIQRNDTGFQIRQTTYYSKN